MDESLLNHLFLPWDLSSSAKEDFLSRNEHQLLNCINNYFNTIQSTTIITLPVLETVRECIQRWSLVQNPSECTQSTIQSTLEQLALGSFMPFYFHTQNAAILVEIDDTHIDQPLISAWQVQLPTAEITSSILPHLSCFPAPTYRLNDRSELISTVHCELLVEFLKNTIEWSKSTKASREVSEIRDVPESHYVCQWWIQHFKEIQIHHETNQFTKKHRDQIRWNNALLPFRRSGLWMTIKTVIHLICIKRLRNMGTMVYKLFMTHFLTHILISRETSIDRLVHCIRKILRRLHKIDTLLSTGQFSDINQWSQWIKHDIQVKINRIFPKLHGQNPSQYSIQQIKLDESNMYQHSFEQLKSFLK